MNLNKYVKKFFLVFLVLLGYTALFSQTRSTIWMDGISTNSPGYNVNKWGLNWDFEDVVSTNTNFNAGYDPGRGVFDASSYAEPLLDDHENVMGIAHDFGGLILRDLANNNDAITAMILNGVPNQGSSAIKFVTGENLPPNGGETRAQNMIAKVNAIKGENDCEECGFMQLFENWIDEIAANEDLFKEMSSNSTEVNFLNEEENLPDEDVAVAILYGTVTNKWSGKQSIISLMDSRGSPLNPWDTGLQDCVARKLAEQREDAKPDTREIIDRSMGIFEKVVGFAADLLTQGFIDNETGEFESAGFIGSLAGLITDVADDIFDWIEASEERDAELARLLRCQVANQTLAAEWELAMMEEGAFDTEEVEIEESLYYCEQLCWDQLGPNASRIEWGSCIRNCVQSKPTKQITVYVGEDHDLLLTEGEQKLPNSDFTYNLFDHNHFQEPRDDPYSTNNTIGDAFEELFSGSAGSAFQIPEK